MFWRSSSHYWHGTLSRNRLGTRRARPRFCILDVLGDVLDNGELHFAERAQTLEAARRRIETLAEVRPGQYVIYNAETGERVFITARVFRVMQMPQEPELVRQNNLHSIVLLNNSRVGSSDRLSRTS